MEKKPQAPVEVTLAKAHEHDGVQYAAGDKILVSAPEHDWLLAQHIITAPSAAKETK